MSIKLRLEKGAIVMQAVLEDAAFAELLTLIQTHESKDAAPSPAMAHSTHISESKALPGDISDPSQRVKGWMAQRAAAEVLNQIGWKTNVEKILLLGAHYEAKGGAEGWKSSDMADKFKEAKEGFPGNFARDVATAVKEGLLATITPRTYTISRTGWSRISAAIV